MPERKITGNNPKSGKENRWENMSIQAAIKQVNEGQLEPEIEDGLLALNIEDQQAAEPQSLISAALRFQELMLVYDSGIRQMVTKLETWKKEITIKGQHVPIESLQSRLKRPESIAKKLRKNGFSVTLDSMKENLHDIAGIRVICPYISDIYTVRDMVVSQPDIHLLEEKDYVKNPKDNGYRSLHLIVETDICMSESIERVKLEIQLRTLSMDSWAALEHKMRYKSREEVPDDIDRRLKACAEVMALADREMEGIAEQLNVFDSKTTSETEPIFSL
jgi:putative GTP pyrophosphokinase